MKKYTLAACLAALCVPSINAQTLTIEKARQTLLSQHPSIGQYVWQNKALTAEKSLAAQGAPLSLSIESSDIAGSGEYQKFDSAETSISLNSAIELGGKKNARIQTSQAKIQRLQMQQKIQTLQLIQQLYIRFANGLAQQALCETNQKRLALSKKARALVKIRVSQAASPEAELVHADLAYQEALAKQESCLLQLQVSYLAIAEAIGEKAPHFKQLQGQLFKLPEFDWPMLEEQFQQSIWRRLEQSQIQLSERKIEQIKTDNALNLQWQVGLNHYSASGDNALSVGFEIPLGNSARNRPALQKASSDHALLLAQLKQQQLLQYRELKSAFLQYQLKRQQLKQLQNVLLPLLEKAYQQAQSAYQQGRYNYSQWLNAGNLWLEKQEKAIEIAQSAYSTQAKITLLSTGETL